jgi:hypothetical protein
MRGTRLIEYPGLYAATDAASLRAQRSHFRVIRLQLALFFLVALTAGLATVVPNSFRQELAVVTAVLLAIAITTAWTGRVRQFERVWFNCRAIAESVKSASWLYMMRVPPFGQDDSADATFASRLQEILSAWAGYETYFTDPGTAGHTASLQMRQIRQMGFQERKHQYVTLRQSDQQKWYGGKCKVNGSKATQWFWITTTLPLVALVLAILQARYGPTPINVISPLMTLAASFVAWSQSKRYEELAQAYSLAALELQHLSALTTAATTEESLIDVVVDTEDAISREHKMWCVKRSIRVPG